MAGDIITASGAKLYRGPAVTSANADTLAEFLAITAWTEVGLVETLGEFGDESTAVTFAAIGDGRVRKAKGARDAGTMAITVAHTPEDAGQEAMEDAERTNDNYAFKIELPDAPTEDWSNSLYFFRGLVMSQRLNVGGNDNVVRKTYNLGVNSEVFVDPAAES